jgi:hypothetical protein
VEDPPKEGSEGYPEEQPEEVAGDDERSGDRDDRERDKPDEADRGDEGTATGNPRSAG